MTADQLPERLASKIEPEPMSGCWLWTAGTNGGYGTIRWGGPLQKAHRITYELLRGVVPEGLELDHTCRNTFCVNPWHLDAVTHQENMRRAVKTHCPRGHLYDEANTGPNGPARRCRACHRQAEKLARRRRKETL